MIERGACVGEYVDLRLDGAGPRFSGFATEIGLGMGQGQCCGSEKEVGEWTSERRGRLVFVPSLERASGYTYTQLENWESCGKGFYGATRRFYVEIIRRGFVLAAEEAIGDG